MAFGLVVILAGLSLPSAASAQRSFKWDMQRAGTTASLRGLSVVNDATAWASGTGGTVLRTTDGTSWSDVSVPQARELDFRDIHAFSATEAVVLSAGSPGRIFRTEDGGGTWRRVHSDERAEIFFDGMAFWDEQHGMAFGDPIDGRLVIIVSNDGGRTWRAAQGPEAPSGIAGFAASGTGLCVLGDAIACIGTGGKGVLGEGREGLALAYRTTNRGRSWTRQSVPMPSSESAGVFSIAFADHRIGVAVGGDYRQPDRALGNVAVTRDGGRTWSAPAGRPRGYRSCVAVVQVSPKARLWIAVGPSGTDVSESDGDRWRQVDAGPFHVVAAARSGRAVWAAGPGGRMARALIGGTR